VLAAALSSLVDLVLPRTCVACRAPDGPLCPACGPAHVLHADHDPPLAAAAVYDGAVRTALLAYKERGRRDLARSLGVLLARAVGGCPDAVLVPVPSTSRARRERGGDHVLRLARVAARECGTTVAAPLRLVRPVRDSVGLDVAARIANLGGAMAARYTPGRRALIVDDIVTTGSTLREAARALRVAGWDVSGAAVVAATQRHCGTPSRGGSPASGLAWA
jgi:predicted amidophosphoribosyltransferase